MFSKQVNNNIMSDESLIRFDDCSSPTSGNSIFLLQLCSDNTNNPSPTKSLLETSPLPLTPYKARQPDTPCRDQTEENLCGYSYLTTRENSIQYSPSDIINVEDSMLASFNASDSSFIKTFEESLILENETFGFGIPPDVLEEILNSPEEKCNRESKNSTVTTKEFSEITVRPPILSPPVYDPMEEIFQEARRIARRLSLHTLDFSEKGNEAFVSQCQKNVSDIDNTELKNNQDSMHKEAVERTNVESENKENDSRGANSMATVITRTDVGTSPQAENSRTKLFGEFKKPKPVKNTDSSRQTISAPQQETCTEKSGMPVIRRSTFAVRSERKSTDAAEEENSAKLSRRAKLTRRRSNVTTKQELECLEAEYRKRNSSGSSTSSTSSTASSPAFFGANTTQKLSRFNSRTPKRVPKPTLYTPTRAKDIPGPKPTANSSFSLLKKPNLVQNAKMSGQASSEASCPLTPGGKCTPSRIRAPSRLTPKSVPKEKTMQMTPLKVAPKFNLKM